MKRPRRKPRPGAPSIARPAHGLRLTEAHLIGGNQSAADTITALFESIGIKVVNHPAKKARKK